ncbi:MAG: FAD-dependent monooxygenase [Nocardioidaceae bacterium]
MDAAQLATTFRSGPVFLTGDAAHRVTPRGGTGMNTAVQDASTSGGSSGSCCPAGPDADLLESLALG